MQAMSSRTVDSFGSEISTFARRQMEKMGWTEGKGLGKEEQGMASYVKVKKRVEHQGLGTETVQREAHQTQWWYNVYDKVASEIELDPSKKKTKKDKKKRKKKLKKKRAADFEAPTDEALFRATGGKLFGRRAYGSCKGKLMRTAT